MGKKREKIRKEGKIRKNREEEAKIGTVLSLRRAGYATVRTSIVCLFVFFLCVFLIFFFMFFYACSK